MAQPRFKFTGEPKMPKTESKRPFLKKFTKDGTEMVSMNFGIMESKGNMGFVESFGSKQKKIKTYDNDGNQIEINWDDRFDSNIIKSVANYRKYIVDLGDDLGGRNEFITQYDAILFLSENLPKYKGKICVTGQMVKQWYDKQYYDKFTFNSVYAVDNEHKNRLMIFADIYYKKDCIDTSDWKEERKIYIDGYIQMYINKDEGTKYVPQRFVFNASKYKEDNEHHQNLLKYKLKYIKCDKKKWHHLLWECVLQNGAEEIDFDESQLTDAQKEQIELGVRTLEDFRPNGAIFGNGVHEYRLFEPTLKNTNDGDFSEGFIDADISDNDFEDSIYQPPENEKMSDVIKNSNNEDSSDKEDSKSDENIDDEDLW